jgi:tRNA dimethylallyltransferase
MSAKRLIVILGPTAVGKTALCIRLAKQLGCAIVSADSRQFYKEMQIGTAKPTPSEMAEVPHYLVDFLSITENYNAGRYEKEALEIIEKLFKKDDHVILSGGSGLYISALCEGIDDMPRIDPWVRERLIEEWKTNGLEPLLMELQTADNQYFEKVDQANPQRVLRALEVIRATGKPYSDFRVKKRTAIFDPQNRFGTRARRTLRTDRCEGRSDARKRFVGRSKKNIQLSGNECLTNSRLYRNF